MIGYDDLAAMAQLSRDTLGDEQATREWSEQMGYDLDGISRASQEFAGWWVGYLAQTYAGFDLVRAVAAAFSAGLEIGVRAENLRNFREQIGES